LRRQPLGTSRREWAGRVEEDGAAEGAEEGADVRVAAEGGPDGVVQKRIEGGGEVDGVARPELVGGGGKQPARQRRLAAREEAAGA
jgi:hypothetical protein